MLRRGVPGGARVRYSLAAWLAVSYIVTMVIGVAGLVLIKEVRLKLLLVAFYLGILVPSIITLGASRYRLPTMPIIMLGASYLLAHGAGLWRSSSLKLRLAAVGAALAVLAIMAVRWHELTHPVWS